MKKYTPVFSLVLLITGVMVTLHYCTPQVGDGVFDWVGHTPASWGKYKIDSIANEVGLIRLYPELDHSECGLADDDFIRYAMDRVDYSRKFQFIVFIPGKPLVGERCLRKAYLFYLK